MVTYRDFEEDDLYEVVRLANDALDESYNGGLFLQLADLYPNGFIVAEKEEEGIVGFVLGVVERAYEARILVLAVEEEHRQEGIGSTLVEMFLDRYEDHGVEQVNLEVRVSNDGAISFYEDLGFEQKKVLSGYYADDEDAYLMKRRI